MRDSIIVLFLAFTSLNVSGQYQDDSLASQELFDRGLEAFENGDFKSGNRLFHKAIEKDSTNYNAFAMLGNCYFALYEFEKARSYFDFYLKYYPDNTVFWYRKAIIEFELKDYNSCIEYANKAIYLGLEDEVLYVLRGRSYGAIGNLEQSYSDLKRATELGAYLDAYYYLGIIAFDLGKLEESFSYIDYYIKREDTQNLILNAYLSRARIYRYLGRFQEALADIQKYEDTLQYETQQRINYDATIPEVLRIKGICYTGLGENDIGYTFLKESLKLESHPSAHYYIGGIYFQREDTENAKSHFEAIIRSTPEDGYPYIVLAFLYYNKEDYVTSLSYLKQTEGKTTGFIEMTDYLKESAMLYIYHGEIESAIQCHLEYLKLNPDDQQIKQELEGVFSKNMPKYITENLKYYDIISSKFDKNSKEAAYFQALKSMLYFEVNDYESALNEINKTIDIHLFSEYYALRSFIYFKKYTELEKQEKQEEHLLKLKNQIFKDIENALESNHRKVDAYMLKTTYLMYFEMRNEACKTANEAVKLGAKINKDQLKSICTGKEPKEKNNEWEFNYNLSSWNELFSK